MSTIVTRSGKGSALTHTEGDANFNNLNTDKLENLSEDNSPQLSASLDVNGQSIVSVSNGDINITPDGSGKVVLDGLNYPTADGSNGQVMSTDGSGNIGFSTVSSGSSTLSGLTDTAISTPSNGQVLAYNSGSSKFTNQGIDISGKSINDLSDVSASGPSDGQILTYSNANSRFEATTPSAGGGVSYALGIMNFSAASGGSYTSASTFVSLSLGDTPSEQVDDDSVMTMGSNGSTTTHFTLTAGKYEIRTYVTGYYETGDSAAPDDWAFELYNSSDSTSVMNMKFNGDYDNIFTSSYGRWPFQFTMPAYVNISGSKNFIYRIAANLSSQSRQIEIRADGGRSHYYNQTKDGGVVVTVLKVG